MVEGYGRGTDFPCNDLDVQNNGGVHVVATYRQKQNKTKSSLKAGLVVKILRAHLNASCSAMI